MSEFEDENTKKLIGNPLIAPESDSLIMQQHEVDNRDLKIPRFRCTGTGTAPCLAIFGNDISSLPGNLAV